MAASSHVKSRLTAHAQSNAKLPLPPGDAPILLMVPLALSGALLYKGQRAGCREQIVSCSRLTLNKVTHLTLGLSSHFCSR